MDHTSNNGTLLDSDSSEVNGDVIIENENEKQFDYAVEDTPPWLVIFTVAIQHMFIGISFLMPILVVVSEAACADINDPVRSVLFSSSVLASGLSTVVQSYIGLRLPVFQGPSGVFLIPILALKDVDAWKCPTVNDTTNITLDSETEFETPDIVYQRLAEIQGSLIAASVFEVFIGLTGFIGILMKFITPIVTGVTIFCLGYSLYPVPIMLCRANWAIGIGGLFFLVLMAIYMAHIRLPVPRCTSNRKSEMKRDTFPVFQVFPVLITLIVMWITCVIFTVLNVFSDDPQDTSYMARTDVRNGLIRETPWVLLPYPGQVGIPRINTAIFIGFLISVITSIIESLGDYIATSRVCNAYPVPRHAINRGIAVEGIFSVLSGFLGTGHATTSYSTSLSIIEITKIHSRIVLVVTGILSIVFAIFGKFGALMTTVPDPVLGGITLGVIGKLCSVGISIFHSVELRSSRNKSVIGVSIFVAIVMAEWQRQFPDSLRTEFDQLNQIVNVTVGNAMFVGFILSLILDNTVKGSDKERGIVKDPLSRDDHVTSRPHLYDLPVISRLQSKCRVFRRLPFCQPYDDSTEKQNDIEVK